MIKMPLLFRVGKKGWKSQVQSPTIPRVVQESVMFTSPLPHHMIPISVVEGPLVTRTPQSTRRGPTRGPNITLSEASNPQISSVLLG